MVNEINSIVLEMLDGDKIEYLSNDSLIEEGNSHQYPIEFLNSIELPSMPPHCLHIKKKAIIMLLVNLDQRNGHCNGTRYQVLNVSKHVLEAIALNGKAEGKKLIIPRINFLSKDTQFPFQMKRKQFPIRLSYAITANKSQGQTLKFVGIYLGTEFFSHGQVYVSLSRVGDKKKILIFRRDKKLKMKNIVFKEIL
jgi:ATP-dependent DNA helicase PIF1